MRALKFREKEKRLHIFGMYLIHYLKKELDVFSKTKA